MAVASTLTTLRREAMLRIGKGLGSAIGQVIATGDWSVAATTITSTRYFRNTNWGSSHLQSMDAGAFRFGAASAADFYRPMGALVPSTGVVTVDTYSDTTIGTEDLEVFFHGVRADIELLDLINLAMRYCFIDSYEALSHLSDQDGSMVASTDTLWTDVGTLSTSAKDTTAIRTPWGERNYHLVNNAVANSGTRSATVSCEEGSQISLWAIASCNVGSASLIPRDITAGAAFSNAPTVTHDEQEPMFLHQPWIATPADCKRVAMDLIGTSASGDIYWNQAWLYKRNVLRINLPAHMSEGFKIGDIYRTYPRASISTTNVYQAQSLQKEKLYEGKDYDWIMAQGDANPHAVIFKNASYFDTPLLLQTRRPASDFGTLSAEGDTTKAPLNQIVPRIVMEWAQRVYMPRFPNDEKWVTVFSAAQSEWEKATRVRTQSDPAPRPYYSGVGLA